MGVIFFRGGRESLMKCTICGEEIVLVPSAKERAAKFGGAPSDYSNLFTTHAQCSLSQSNRETLELMRRLRTSSIEKKLKDYETELQASGVKVTVSEGDW
jgi:hypothetical protein